MRLIPMFEHITTYVTTHWRLTTKALPGMMHAIADFVRSTPSNAWAMCAFVAAASIMVTLVTAYLWPRETPSAPVRETIDASGVRRMAQRGVATPDIARRTGLSHDAVATILRAGATRRTDHPGATRKSRPTAA
jgi:hypothetical protein